MSILSRRTLKCGGISSLGPDGLAFGRAANAAAGVRVLIGPDGERNVPVPGGDQFPPAYLVGAVPGTDFAPVVTKIAQFGLFPP